MIATLWSYLWSFLFICISYVAFAAIGHVLRTCIICNGTLSKRILALSKSEGKAAKKSWRVANTSTSLIHSSLSGLGAFGIFFVNPEYCEELIYQFNPAMFYLTHVCIGYFIYDITDLFKNDVSAKTVELMVHHVIVVMCFGLAILTHRYIGYAMVALLIELNSIFLHCRSLCNLLGVDPASGKCRAINFLNMATFITCRIMTMAWMTHWLVSHRAEVPFLAFTCGSVGLAFLTVANIVLLYRIIVADFKRGPAVGQRQPVSKS